MKLSLARLCTIGICSFLAACAITPPKPPTPPEKITWEAIRFDDLPHWGEDDLEGARAAFAKSCSVQLRKGDRATFSTSGRFGLMRDWRAACDAAQDMSVPAIRYFESYFSPYRAAGFTAADGLFTGYYEPDVAASVAAQGRYQTPLWSRPDDLLIVQLGDFDDSLRGRKITGKVSGQTMKPYDTRGEIAAGSLNGRAKPLAFAADPVDAFFMEIQGSGRLIFPDGTVRRVGFDAQNGRAYSAIGGILKSRGLVSAPVTMKKIRAYFSQNPGEMQKILNENKSQIFFKWREETDPLGAMGVPLTAERSMAVDPKWIPLGAPLWLTADAPAHVRLVIAQDTGGAIKGPVRGDLFWGHGPDAADQAGSMQSKGLYYLLLPQTVVPSND